MKQKHIYLLIICIAAYIITGAILYFRIEIPVELTMHFIYSLIGMTGLIILNVRYPSGFIVFLTIIAYMFYILTGFGSICLSLIRNDISAFQNLGILAKTEGFLVVAVLGYIFNEFWKKRHRKDS